MNEHDKTMSKMVETMNFIANSKQNEQIKFYEELYKITEKVLKDKKKLKRKVFLLSVAGRLIVPIAVSSIVIPIITFFQYFDFKKIVDYCVNNVEYFQLAAAVGGIILFIYNTAVTIYKHKVK